MDVRTEIDASAKNRIRLVTFGLGGCCLWLLIDNGKWCILPLGAIWLLATANPTLIYVLAATLRRDLIAIQRFMRFNLFVLLAERRRWTLATMFARNVQRHPTKAAFIMDGRTLTFHDVDRYARRVSGLCKAHGFRRGDCVALLMETRLEYTCVWLGLARIGVVTALINSNLRRQPLAHSIKAAQPKALVCGTELIDALQQIIDDERSDDADGGNGGDGGGDGGGGDGLRGGGLRQMTIFQFSDAEQRIQPDFRLLPGAIDLSEALATMPDDVGDDEDDKTALPHDKLIYIYTSGTTGMPKPAVITNLRFILMSCGIFFIFGLHRDDIIYDTLPLYHTSGSILGVSHALIHGCTIVLRKKFSASNFWSDCVRYRCTVAQYIGELCRYLLATPPNNTSDGHRVRLMFGNGLRPNIWRQFMERFRIANIGELYGSTEGNCNLGNFTNQIGAIGFLPIVGRSLAPVRIIRCHEVTGEPLRNAYGRCIVCRPGETGLIVGKVNARRAVMQFHGYLDRAASEKKLLRDVFASGDVYFNSGDMVVEDLFGYVYFKDRTGDTFRWRGENVSTQEVEAVVMEALQMRDCVVYGVEIPHVEGKAGMVAIVDPERSIDVERLAGDLSSRLPTYARPLFVRLLNKMPCTGTFKMQKRELMAQAYDVERITDPLFYLTKAGRYTKLTRSLYDELRCGRAGL